MKKSRYFVMLSIIYLVLFYYVNSIINVNKEVFNNNEFYINILYNIGLFIIFFSYIIQNRFLRIIGIVTSIIFGFTSPVSNIILLINPLIMFLLIDIIYNLNIKKLNKKIILNIILIIILILLLFINYYQLSRYDISSLFDDNHYIMYIFSIFKVVGLISVYFVLTKYINKKILIPYIYIILIFFGFWISALFSQYEVNVSSYYHGFSIDTKVLCVYDSKKICTYNNFFSENLIDDKNYLRVYYNDEQNLIVLKKHIKLIPDNFSNKYLYDIGIGEFGVYIVDLHTKEEKLVFNPELDKYYSLHVREDGYIYLYIIEDEIIKIMKYDFEGTVVEINEKK